jgi:hydrogenase maturation protease
VTKLASRETAEAISRGESSAGSASAAPVLILGLGNELLKDDAVGIRVAERLQGSLPQAVEVRATSLFGLSLLDDLVGREKVLLIDSYLPKDPANAEIREFGLDSLSNAQAPSPHFVGLAEIREVMRSLDLGFPREVRVLAIPVTDPLTFSYEMSPEVEARMDEAAQRARKIVQAWLPESVPTSNSGARVQ